MNQNNKQQDIPLSVFPPAEDGEPPFRGRRGDFARPKNGSVQWKRTYDGHAQVFDTSKKKDVAAYEDVLARALKNSVVILGKEISFVPKREAYMIFLEWADVYNEAPEIDPMLPTLSKGQVTL